MISFVLPTRDRPAGLAETLRALGSLAVTGEVIVVDNASAIVPEVPRTLANGLTVWSIRCDANLGAAARNLGVGQAAHAHEWVVMLDDDSHPLDGEFVARLALQPADVAAVSADITLPHLGRRESGGLPEVFIGCGVAVRRRVFLELGGYDPSFGYYAEEYDLAAKMIRAGYRVVFDPAFRVAHRKDQAHRDMDTILARLVRNNGWVMQRYAPDEGRRAELREVRSRYRRIAEKERAVRGLGEGLIELRRTRHGQARTPMTGPHFDRFTGLAHAREALQAEFGVRPFRTARVIAEGKNAWVVRRALAELGARITDHSEEDVRVIGTMSPGPMLDAIEETHGSSSGSSAPRVLAPWVVGSALSQMRDRASSAGDVSRAA